MRDEEIERIARELCIANGRNPDNTLGMIPPQLQWESYKSYALENPEEYLAKFKAKQELTRLLWESMERSDPSTQPVTWETADIQEVNFVRTQIERMSMHGDLWKIACSFVERKSDV